jgi:hypothetical protein
MEYNAGTEIVTVCLFIGKDVAGDVMLSVVTNVILPRF